MLIIIIIIIIINEIGYRNSECQGKGINDGGILLLLLLPFSSDSVT